jgi:hypothetical protein
MQRQIPAVAGDGLVSDNQFNGVFWSKFMDNRWEHNRLHGFSTNRCHYFSFLKQNGQQMIWLRSTGSTVISQLFDSLYYLVSLLDDW